MCLLNCQLHSCRCPQIFAAVCFVHGGRFIFTLSLITGQTLRISICCHGIETHSQKRTAYMHTHTWAHTHNVHTYALLHNYLPLPLTSPRLREYNKNSKGSKKAERIQELKGAALQWSCFLWTWPDRQSSWSRDCCRDPQNAWALQSWP